MSSNFKNLAISTLLAIAGLTSTTVAADATPQTRIVGGDRYDIEDAPATVALLNRGLVERDGDLFNAHFCGGTLIRSNWVLTAAHCVVDDSGNVRAPANYMVLIGSTSLLQPTTQPVNVAQVIVHPDYRSSTEGSDIALLRLEFAAGTELAALNSTDLESGDFVFAAGWGAVNAGSRTDPQRFPGTLMGTVVQAIPGEQCNVDFPAYTGFVYPTNVCASIPNGGQDSCQGDSGGPLYATEQLANGFLGITGVAGITSWGIGCGDAEHPGVYTNVASFTTWIQDTMNTGNGSSNGNDPVDNPVNDPADTPANENIDNLLADAGSAGGFLMALFGLTLAFRQRRAVGFKNTGFNLPSVPVIATALTFLVTAAGVQQVQATDTPSNVLSMLGQPIGEQRDDIFDGLKEHWQSEPVCTTLRTGFGKTRRAYFLETCTFKNPAGHTLWDATPSVVEYRFLENSLVQMSFAFDEMADAKKFRLCANEQNEELAKSTDKKLSIKVEEDFRTTLSNIEEVEQIHSLRNTL